MLYYYFQNKEVGCPNQGLTFVLKIKCPEKQMIFDYGKMMYNSPLKDLDPTKYKLLGYYAGLSDEIVNLKADKVQLDTYKKDLQDCIDDCGNIGLKY